MFFMSQPLFEFLPDAWKTIRHAAFGIEPRRLLFGASLTGYPGMSDAGNRLSVPDAEFERRGADADPYSCDPRRRQRPGSRAGCREWLTSWRNVGSKGRSGRAMAPCGSILP
jgi:hypothetical protein